MGTIWSILITIVIGFFAGLLAKLIIPGKQGGGFIVTTILGIVGAFVGGFLGELLNINLNNFIGAVIGAIIVLLIYGFVMKKK